MGLACNKIGKNLSMLHSAFRNNYSVCVPTPSAFWTRTRQRMWMKSYFCITIIILLTRISSAISTNTEFCSSTKESSDLEICLSDEIIDPVKDETFTVTCRYLPESGDCKTESVYIDHWHNFPTDLSHDTTEDGLCRSSKTYSLQDKPTLTGVWQCENGKLSASRSVIEKPKLRTNGEGAKDKLFLNDTNFEKITIICDVSLTDYSNVSINFYLEKKNGSILEGGNKEYHLDPNKWPPTNVLYWSEHQEGEYYCTVSFADRKAKSNYISIYITHGPLNPQMTVHSEFVGCYLKVTCKLGDKSHLGYPTGRIFVNGKDDRNKREIFMYEVEDGKPLMIRPEPNYVNKPFLVFCVIRQLNEFNAEFPAGGKKHGGFPCNREGGSSGVSATNIVRPTKHIIYFAIIVLTLLNIHSEN